MTGFARVVASAALAVAVAALAAPADVPQLTGRVVDAAEILKAPTRAELTELLRTHEQRSGDQIAVLTVPTIGDDSIEDFARRVFEQWKLGKKGRDNGVLMIVVPNDRKMRIEVGYGLEGALPDLAANRIVRNQMAPRFKEGDYDRGVLDGARAVVAALEGTAPGAGEATTEAAARHWWQDADIPVIPWPMRILFGLFIFGILGVFTAFAVVTPGMGWFLYLFLIPFWAIFPIAAVGVLGEMILIVVYLVGVPIAKLMWSRTASYQKALKTLSKKAGRRLAAFMPTGRAATHRVAAVVAAAVAATAAFRAAAEARAAVAAREAGSRWRPPATISCDDDAACHASALAGSEENIETHLGLPGHRWLR